MFATTPYYLISFMKVMCSYFHHSVSRMIAFYGEKIMNFII